MEPYIKKADIVAEIEERIKECDKLADAAADNNLSNTQQANELLIRQYTSLLHFLDTLEVKEVDLEKEIELVKGDYEQVDVAWNNDFDFIARYFFELGLKTKENKL